MSPYKVPSPRAAGFEDQDVFEALVDKSISAFTIILLYYYTIILLINYY